MITIKDLPPELLAVVFTSFPPIPDEEPIPLNRTSPSDVSALCSLSLVNHQWRLLAQPILFTFVALRTRNALHSFLAVLEKRPELGKCVQVLRVQGMDDKTARMEGSHDTRGEIMDVGHCALEKILSLCEGLRVLVLKSIESLPASVLSPASATLEKLVLHDTAVMDVIQTGVSFSFLRQLVLFSSHFHHPGGTSRFFHPNTFPFLECLVLFHADFSPPLEDEQLYFSNLVFVSFHLQFDATLPQSIQAHKNATFVQSAWNTGYSSQPRYDLRSDNIESVTNVQFLPSAEDGGGVQEIMAAIGFVQRAPKLEWVEFPLKWKDDEGAQRELDMLLGLCKGREIKVDFRNVSSWVEDLVAEDAVRRARERCPK